jgi:hypothetical protein
MRAWESDQPPQNPSSAQTLLQHSLSELHSGSGLEARSRPKSAAGAWTSISNNHNPWDDGMPDVGAANQLAEAQVLRDGEPAPHAGLCARHFTKPPFPPKKGEGK